MRILGYKDLKPEKGIPYSKAHIRRLEQAGKFPKHVKIGPSRKGWVDDEIDGYLKAKIAERDANEA
jgi:prophage regulatory protein